MKARTRLLLRLLPVFSLFAACGGGAVHTTTTPSFAPPPGAAPTGRLPTGIAPVEYDIALRIDPNIERFEGWVTIKIESDRAWNGLWLHARDLAARTVTIQHEGSVTDGGLTILDPVGVAWLGAASEVPAGRATIRIAYDAPFGPTLEGLFRVHDGDDHYAFTQLEAIAARRIFPSFDEPGFKTPMTISVGAPAPMRVVSNMPEADLAAETIASGEWESNRHAGLVRDGFVLHQFAPTPPLPTYLACIAVGNLDIVEQPSITPHGARTEAIPFRGVAMHGRAPRMAHALARTPAIVHALEDYFGIPYPYPKLDIIAFQDMGGAMENAGAITFNEWLVFITPDSPAAQRGAFENVMAHELAHQWFGNLVTAPWWDDIWLNEAFATWIATKIVTQTEPSLAADSGQIEEMFDAMAADSVSTARRIRQPIETHHDIENAFDSITYEKGATVLAMFESWIGADRFRDGIREYITTHVNGSGSTSDLLTSLEHTSGRNVTVPFGTFVDQPGLPEITFRAECPGNAPARLSMTQRRWVPVGSHIEQTGPWQVPVCVRYSVATDGADAEPHRACTLLEGATGHLDLTETGTACPIWFAPNADGRGYYRYVLPTQATEPLGGAFPAGHRGDWVGPLFRSAPPARGRRTRGAVAAAPSPFTRLSEREAALLVDSLLGAVRSGAMRIDTLLEVMPEIARHPSRHVALGPSGTLHFLYEEVLDEATRPALVRAIQTWYAPQLARLGVASRANEPSEDRLFRAELLAFLDHPGADPTVRRMLAERGRAFLGADQIDPAAVSPDLASLAVGVAVREEGESLFARAQTSLASEIDPARRGWLIAGIGSARGSQLVARALDLSLTDALRPIEKLAVLRTVFGRSENRAQAWDWLATNVDVIHSNTPDIMRGRAMSLAATTCDRASRERARTVLERVGGDVPGAPRDLAAALERSEMCEARVAQLREAAIAFFRAYVPTVAN